MYYIITLEKKFSKAIKKNYKKCATILPSYYPILDPPEHKGHQNLLVKSESHFWITGISLRTSVDRTNQVVHAKHSDL